MGNSSTLMELQGYFNPKGEPVIQIDLGAGAVELLVDSGFGGGLILPTSAASGLTLTFEGFEEFFTATWQAFSAATYALELEWLGRHTRVSVALSDDVTEALWGVRC